MVATRLHRVGRLGSGIERLRELDDFKLTERVRTKYMEFANRQIFKPSISEVGVPRPRLRGRLGGNRSGSGHCCHHCSVTVADINLQALTVPGIGFRRATRPAQANADLLVHKSGSTPLQLTDGDHFHERVPILQQGLAYQSRCQGGDVPSTGAKATKYGLLCCLSVQMIGLGIKA